MGSSPEASVTAVADDDWPEADDDAGDPDEAWLLAEPLGEGAEEAAVGVVDVGSVTPGTVVPTVAPGTDGIPGIPGDVVVGEVVVLVLGCSGVAQPATVRRV